MLWNYIKDNCKGDLVNLRAKTFMGYQIGHNDTKKCFNNKSHKKIIKCLDKVITDQLIDR